MIISEEIYKIDNSDSAKRQIDHLNKRRAELIALREPVTLEMAKGFLDYHALSKDRFSWRFESVYNESGTDFSDEESDEFGVKTREKALEAKCSFQSAEEFYNEEYRVDYIAKDKTDEFLNETSSRKYDIEVQSIPYQDIRYLFTKLLKNDVFDTPEFEREFEAAKFWAAVKGVGFMRPVIYNQKTTQRFVELEETKDGIVINPKKFTEKKVTSKSGLRLESVDPETVFVDPTSTEPEELFIITPYTALELINRYPTLEKHIEEYRILEQDLNPESNKALDVSIGKESLYNFHAGELLLEIFESKDLFNPLYNRVFENGSFVSNRHPFLRRGMGSYYWDSILNHSLEESRRRYSYFVTEYYNVRKDLYVVYIDQTLLYKGPMLEPFKKMPIVPVYLNTNYRNFYNEPLTKSFAHFQNQYNQDNHLQNLASLVTGRQLLVVQDDKINELYHPEKQIEIVKNAPVNIIHTNGGMDNGTGQEGGVAVNAINLNNGADAVLENKKTNILNRLERQYPTLKTLAANNPPEMQRDMIFSRDLASNSIIKRLTRDMTRLAQIVFSCKIFELKYLAKDLDKSIPVFDSNRALGIIVESTIEKMEQRKKKNAEELEKLHQKQLLERVNQLSQNQDLVKQITDKLMAQIETKVIEQYTQKPVPEDPVEREAVVQAIMETPEVVGTLQQMYQETKEQRVLDALYEIAQDEIKPIPDLNVYFSFETLTDIEYFRDVIKFKFDKSTREQQNAMVNLINYLKPMEQFMGYVIKPTEWAWNAVTAAGYDPNLMLEQQVPSPKQMVQNNNTRLTAFMGVDKNPAVFAAILNEQLGEERFSVDMLLEAEARQMQLASQFKQEEIVLRNNSKASTNIVQDQARNQMKNEMSVADFERQKMEAQLSGQETPENGM